MAAKAIAALRNMHQSYARLSFHSVAQNRGKAPRKLVNYQLAATRRVSNWGVSAEGRGYKNGPSTTGLRQPGLTDSLVSMV